MLERLASNSSANKKCIIRITSLFFLSFFGFFFSLLRLMLSLHTFHGPDSDVVKPNSVCVRVFVSHREIVDLELIHLHFHRNERTTSLPQINTLETEEFSLSAKTKLHKRQQLVKIAEFIETHFGDHHNQCRRIFCSGEFSHFKIRTILLWFLCRKKKTAKEMFTRIEPAKCRNQSIYAHSKNACTHFAPNVRNLWIVIRLHRTHSFHAKDRKISTTKKIEHRPSKRSVQTGTEFRLTHIMNLLRLNC